MTKTKPKLWDLEQTDSTPLSNSSVRQRAMGETALLGNPMETSICKSIFAHIYQGHGLSQQKICPRCEMEPEESTNMNGNEM